jgi:hypothetical protein
MAETGIDRAVGEWWASTSALCDLVPIDRVVASVDQFLENQDEDQDEDGYFDDLVVFDATSEPAWRTNSSQGWRTSLTLACMSIDYDRSKAIGQQAIVSWQNQGFSGSAVEIATAKPSGQMTTTQDESTGIWTTSIQFDLYHIGV